MLSLVRFFTRIPTGSTSIERAAKYSYLLPLVGILVGGIVGGFNLLITPYVDDILVSLLTLFALYYITGLNHLDGLTDFADGVYVSASKEKKIKALKDVQIGIAGTTSLIFLLLTLLLIITRLHHALYALIVAEVSAKTCMLVVMLAGKPRKGGSGAVFMKNLNRRLVPISVLFSLGVAYFLLAHIGVLAILISIVVSLVIIKIAHKNFGFVNGDVIGAVNEITRVVALITMVI